MVDNKNFVNVHNWQSGTFNASSGIKIDLRNPKIDTILIVDIAHALGNICRFGGHPKLFYSVAQHSVLVQAMAPKRLKKAALLHDATEAYLGDVIKPLKEILGAVYKELELKFEYLICQKFGVVPEDMRLIKLYDKTALEIEHAAFIKWDFSRWDEEMNKYGMPSGPLMPLHASELFMRAYESLLDL